MAYENLCMYCFKDLNGETVCPHCGGDSRAAVPQIQLLPGTLVYRQRFLVGRALGQDSGGIVYNALDTKRGGVIRIREYLPRNCAERLNDGSVVPVAGMEDAFETGMRKLHASVESPEDPHQRHFYFEENGTAYIAQRKNAAPSGQPEAAQEGDPERRRRILLYAAIAAAVVVVMAIVLVLFLNTLGATDDRTADNPPESVGDGTWSPDSSPTPTPYATATFAALVDPELSWLDYTKPETTNSALEQQLSGQPTKKPELQGNENYPTVNTNSDESNVRELQNRLVHLGWLSYSSVTGKYDNDTKSAVREFQRYVNEYCSPAVKLVEDGIAGKKTQQWLYNSSVSLIRPTATPEPKVTAKPNDGTINSASSESEVRDLQNKLIHLGLLPEGSADGKFGSATQAALKSFQRRVNQLQGYVVLQMDGNADALTRAWLNYYDEEWKRLETATAVPKETPAPTPGPTSAASDGRVDASSSQEEILAVQKLLQQVGLLGASEADGVYGVSTAQAVRNFQSWVNQLRGEETLEVSGAVDDLTMRYLEYCVENGRMYDLPQGETGEPGFEPDYEPGPDPTEVPPEQQAGDGGVTPDSPPESIEFMQEMLAQVGLLDSAHISGHYDSETQVAVRAFQVAANERGLGNLEVTGNCDTETLRLLTQAYDDGLDLSGSLGPEITQAPTLVPEFDGVAPYSTKESIQEMQRMLSRCKLLDSNLVNGEYGPDTEEAVRGLQRAINSYNGSPLVEVTGLCDSKSLQYLQYASKRKLNLSKLAGTPEPTQAASAAPSESADPNGAGSFEDVTPDPNAGETPDPFGGATPEPGAEITPEPSAEVTPEVTGTPEVAATPEVTDTPAPSVGTVGTIHFALSGGEVSGQVELTPGKHEITWGAEGDVQSYTVYLYDGSQNVIQKAENSQMTGFPLNTSAMNPGETYELRIGALPVNGTESDIVWQSLQLTLPVPVTPEPTEAPTPEPSVGKPAINLGSTAYQLDGVQYVSSGSAIFSWMADGQVESYTVNLTYEADGTDYSLGTTTDTSRTVNTAQLKPGTYLLRVGATPVGGGAESTQWSELRFAIPAPEATPEPVQQTTPEPVQQTASAPAFLNEQSTPEEIQSVQIRLYGHGLLDPQAEAGVLDRATLEAIAAFQQQVNDALGYGLTVINPDVDTAVDGQTLSLLFDPNLNLSGQ